MALMHKYAGVNYVILITINICRIYLQKYAKNYWTFNIVLLLIKFLKAYNE